MKPSTLSSKLFKTGQITFQAVFGRRYRHSNDGIATVTVVLSFSFLFIFVESLKNHSKSQKNHKIKNPICWTPRSRSTQ
jgi:hypothetical protein